MRVRHFMSRVGALWPPHRQARAVIGDHKTKNESTSVVTFGERLRLAKVRVLAHGPQVPHLIQRIQK